MILYLDASALVKRYVAKAGSDVAAAIGDAHLVGTSVVSRVEVSGGLARAVRMGLVRMDDGARALADFDAEWADLIRLDVGELCVACGRARLVAEGCAVTTPCISPARSRGRKRSATRSRS